MAHGNENEMDSAVRRLIDNCVGKNLDQLICMDMRGDRYSVRTWHHGIGTGSGCRLGMLASHRLT